MAIQVNAIFLSRQYGIVTATDIDKGLKGINAYKIMANEPGPRAVVYQYDMNPLTLRFIEQYRLGRLDQTTDWVRFDFVD